MNIDTMTIVAMNRYKYPDINIVYSGNNTVTLDSFVRIFRDGMYFLVSVKYTGARSEGDIDNVFNAFHKEVYKVLILYKVTGPVVDLLGNDILYIDVDQRPENERLKLFINN